MTSFPRFSRGALYALLVFFAAAAPAASAESDPDFTALRPLVAPGETAPSFSLKTLDGKTVNFQPGRGKPSLVVFWSAFCPLCREMTPSINDIVARYGSAMRIASINLDGNRFANAVRSFVKENGIRYPVLLDSLRGDFFIASDRYGVEKTPTAVLVDASGKVHSAYAADRMKDLVSKADEILIRLNQPGSVKK